MQNIDDLRQKAVEILAKTSRTFFIPISQLPDGLWDAVTSAYLCMRAIDEIEDHPHLPVSDKIVLLQSISHILLDKNERINQNIDDLLIPYQSILPEVTLRLNDWLRLAPLSIANNIWNSTATMSTGMADWVSKGWQIQSVKDLDEYTYYVAGLVGILLSEIWKWHDELDTDPQLAISFGRGLQAVNIIRNRAEDLHRGVNYFPMDWAIEDMFSYAKRNLEQADRYTNSLPPGPIYNFCKIPLALAHATVATIESGNSKLSRNEVMELVNPYMEH